MRKRILLVEDERDTLKVVSFRLSKAGYEVATLSLKYLLISPSMEGTA